MTCKLGVEEERFLADFERTARLVAEGGPIHMDAGNAVMYELVSTYGVDETVAIMRRRIAQGQETYGAWNPQACTRDMRKERHDEYFDSQWYDWAEFRKEREGGSDVE